jgi:hypothetical protein
MTARPPRFTIGRLMLAVAAVAALLALLRALGPYGRNVALALLVWSIPGLCAGTFVWWKTGPHLRLPDRRLALSAALICAWVGALDAYFLNMTGQALSLLAATFIFPLILGFGASWSAQVTRRGISPRRKSAVVWLVVLAVVASPVSMVFTHWPLRLAFFLSRPALDRLADRVAAGETPGPEWAGLYRIVTTEGSTWGEVALITLDRRGGDSGFVRAGGPVPQGRIPLMVNSNYYVRLGGRWHYQDED